MATVDTLRYTRATLVVTDVFTGMMRDLLKTMVSHSNLGIMTSQKDFLKLLQKHEQSMIGTLRGSYVKEFDIGLIYKIIRHFTFIQAPSRGWGYTPTTGDITVSDDIERIRIVRNSLMHRPNPVLTEPQLDSMFADFKDVSHRFDAYLNKDGTKGYQRAVDEYRTGPIDPESEMKYREEIYKIESI
jgi:hypothetical protein